MDLSEYQILAGNRHPWEIARTVALQDLFKKCKFNKYKPKALDIGCGDGYTVSELFKDSSTEIDAVDTSLTPDLVSFFSQKYDHVSFFNSTVSLHEESYDIVTLFDVIEHTENDYAFLTDISRFAAPGAAFFLTAPAFQSLFSNHDKFLGHYRRYNKNQLSQLIGKAGLELIAIGYIFPSLLMVRAITFTLEKLLGNSSTMQPEGVSKWQHGNFLTQIISSTLVIENKIALFIQQNGISLPGLSVWAICKKPQ